MRIGVPKEIKDHEYRVAVTPAGVRQLVAAHHSVMVEQDCGAAIGFSDDDYRAAGATVMDNPKTLFSESELIVKVKEPQAVECAWLTDQHTIFTYLHLAPDTGQTEKLLQSGCIAIAYETLSEDGETLPLLAPMSEVAGRLATQVGAHYLEAVQGGRGVLLGGVSGAAPASVLVLGGGKVGANAIDVACGMGARVTLVDQSDAVLQRNRARFPGLVTINSRQQGIDDLLADTDLLVGAVLVAGGRAPQVISEPMVKTMPAGSVIVDVAIDQGGCIATSRPTSHARPVFVKHGVTHYCVTNMPSNAARTATQALTAVTLPYICRMAEKGVVAAIKESPALQRGVNIYHGKLVQQAVAEAQGKEWQAIEALLG